MPTSAAANVDVVITAKTLGYTAQMKAAERQMESLKAKTNGLQLATRDMSRHGITDMQAVSGSLRLFEGGLNRSLRTMERFVSQSKVASRVALMAFPAVGAIALSYMMGKIIREASEFIAKMDAVPDAVRAGFQSLNTSAQTANDSLQLTNDKIQATLDKLAGNPGDGLSIALDEARVRADRLATSLAGALDKMNQLMQQQHISFLGGLVTGQDSTNREAGTFKSYNEQIRDAGYSYKDAVRANDPKQIATTKKALVDLLKSAIDKTSSELGAYQRMATIFPGTAPGFKGNVEALKGAHEGYEQQLDAINEDADNAALNKKQNAANAAKNKIEMAKQAAEKVKAAQAAISRAQIQAMNQDHEDFDAAADRSSVSEVQYWEFRILDLKKGSAAYLEAHKNIDAAMKQVQRENATGRDAFGKESDSIASEGANRSALTPENQRRLQDQSKRIEQWNKNMADVRATIAQYNDTMAEASIQYNQAVGRISGSTAARQLAAQHTKEYDDYLRQMQEAKAKINSASYLSPVEKNLELSGIDKDAATARGQRAQQKLQDKYAIEQTTIYGSLTATLRRYAEATTNASEIMNRIAGSALNSINTAFIESAQGRHGAFKGLGRNLIGQGEGALLGGVEGSVIKALERISKHNLGPHGKLGTANNPMIVRDIDAIGKGIHYASRELPGFLHGGAMGFLGHIFQGFFAGGGDVVANRPAIIGERGPEMFIPKSAGRIVPNKQLGGSHQTINIDARGTNPAMVQTAVHRGMAMAYAGAVRTSAKQRHDSSRRRP